MLAGPISPVAAGRGLECAGEAGSIHGVSWQVRCSPTRRGPLIGAVASAALVLGGPAAFGAAIDQTSTATLSREATHYVNKLIDSEPDRAAAADRYLVLIRRGCRDDFPPAYASLTADGESALGSLVEQGGEELALAEISRPPLWADIRAAAKGEFMKAPPATSRYLVALKRIVKSEPKATSGLAGAIKPIGPDVTSADATGYARLKRRDARYVKDDKAFTLSGLASLAEILIPSTYP